MALVRATRVGEAEAEGPQYISKWIAWGAGPRAGQALVLASKARAALEGRTSVTIEDIRAMARPVLRHRLVTTYAAQAEGQTPDTIINRLLDDIPERAGAARADGQVAHVFQS
jgi:MoxR-like ATPase